MQWHSMQEFLAMGGYGFYVWNSFGITFLAMAGELLSLKRRRQRITDMLKQETV